MKTTAEIITSMREDSEAYHKKCKDELKDMEQPMASGMAILAKEAFEDGFAAGVRRASEQ